MSLLKIAVSATSVPPSAMVIDGIQAMMTATVGAVLILEQDELLGIFSERDLMIRVVSKKRDPETTRIADVMTSPVLTISRNMAEDEVLSLMWDRHIRHLPIVDEFGIVEGVVSIRHLLHQKVKNLTQELDSLEAYISADGIGG